MLPASGLMILARRRPTVVLPAPLSPTRAVTLPPSRRTETLSTALTGRRRANGPRPRLTQKCLVRLRPSSTGAIVLIARSPPWPVAASGLASPARPEPARRLGAASTRPPDRPHRGPPAWARPARRGPSPSGRADERRIPRGDPAGRGVTLGSPPAGRAGRACAD